MAPLTILMLALVSAVAAAPAVSWDDGSFIDLLPLLSQMKIGWQRMFGDRDGAERTAERFKEDGVGALQFESIGHLLQGDMERAWDAQKRSWSSVGKAVVDTGKWAAYKVGKIVDSFGPVVLKPDFVLRRADTNPNGPSIVRMA